MSRERLDKLNEINFNWNNVVEDLSALWNKNFLLYKMFIDKYSTPDCELPRVKKNSVMEKWCNTQREHKDYYKKHPKRAYCRLVINPKLEKVKEKFAKLLKKI